MADDDPQKMDVTAQVEMIRQSNGAPDTKAIVRTQYLKGIGSVLIGLGMLVLVVMVGLQSRQNARLERELECRFQVSAEVSDLNDNVDRITGEIFVAAIIEDDAKVAELGMELRDELDRLGTAVASRNEAAEERCR
jgi:hypothetical protein